jgi:TonB family protein
MDSSDPEQRKTSAVTAGAKIVSLSVVFAAALVLFALTGSGHQPQLVAANSPSGAVQPTGESQMQQPVPTKQDGGDADAATASEVAPAPVSRGREVERSEKSDAAERTAAPSLPSPPIISAILQPKVPVRMVQARQPLNPSPASAVIPPEGSSNAFAGAGTRGPEARIVPEPEAMASADSTLTSPGHSIAGSGQVVLMAALQPLPARPDAANTSASLRPENATEATSVDRRPSQSAVEGTRHPSVRTGETTQAVLARFVRPVYPPTATESHIEGEVSLKVDIAADGYVSRVSVLSGNALLAQAAINAVEQWRYRPALVHGSSVEAEEKIIVAFRLEHD